MLWFIPLCPRRSTNPSTPGTGASRQVGKPVASLCSVWFPPHKAPWGVSLLFSECSFVRNIHS